MDERPWKKTGERDPVSDYLSALGEETMRRAWGDDKTAEYRRRVVLGAVAFGRQLEERILDHPSDANEADVQRFLIALMNSVVSEFARSEHMAEETAAEFLSDVETRDYVLELNEVLDEYHSAPDRTLDELLREAVETRRERAIWAQHWSSG